MRDEQGVRYTDGVPFDITERKRAEQELRLTQFSLEHASDAVFWMDPQGRILYVNEAACRSLGRSREELCSLSIPDIDPLFPERVWGTFWDNFKRRGSMTFETQHRTKQGRVFPVEITGNYLEFDGKEYAFAFARDITERQRAERYQSLSAQILGILNEPLGVADVVKQILAAIKRETGLDAVGIRLRSGDDFPYFVQNGFSDEFLLTENTLIARDKNGGPCRDKNGKISLECTCGLVISGQTDPANSLFTKGGSFWTNNSLPLLDLPAHQDPRLHPRDQCVHQGYCSVALIPIRAHGDIVGLLQLNDRKKNCFTLEMIQFLEGISASIGVALMSKQAEEELLFKTALLEAQSETAIDGILVVDTVGHVLLSNGQFARMWNIPEETIRAKNDKKLIEHVLRQLKDPDAFIEKIDYLYAHGTEKTRDEIEFKDGRAFDRYSAPFQDSTGKLWGRIWYFRDITERKRAAETLRASEELLRTMTDQIPGVVFQFYVRPNGERGVYYVSAQAERLFGLSPELSGFVARFVAAIAPESPDALIQSIDKAVADFSEWNYEGLLQKPGGEKVWISVHSTPARRQNEIVFNGMVQDITERRLAEAENARLATIVNSSEGAILSTTREGFIDTWNAGAERIYGYTGEEIKGEHFSIFIPEDGRGEVVSNQERLFRGEALVHYELENMRKDGSKLQVSLTISPIKDATGIVTGVSVIARDITERKRAEEELYQSRQMLETVLDTVPQRVFWKDRNIAYLGCNRAFATDAGLRDPAEIIGKNDYELAWKETAESYRADDKLVMDLDTPRLGFEEPQSRPDGSQIWLRSSKLPLHNRDGKVIGVIGTYEDVTERRRIEQALGESERFLQSTLGALSSHIAILDEKGEIVAVNAAWNRFAAANGGKPDACGVGSNYLEVCARASPSSAEADSAAEGIRQAIAGTRDEFSFEYPCHSPEQKRWFVLRVTRFGDKRPGRVVLAHENITNRKLAEEELRESESRLRTITDSARDAILMMDPQGRISYWNPAAERILGYTSAQALGQDLHSLIVPPRYHEAYQAAFPAFRQTGQGFALGKTRDLEARRKDGKEIPVQLSLSAIQISGDWHAVGILGDITERKQAEEALRRHASEMESAKIAQEENATKLSQLVGELGEAKEQAEAATRAKSEFLANMSHEIRTPMNGVIGMTGLLLDTQLTPEQQHYAEIVRTSGEALLTVINDILDFSKIEARKLVLEITDFDVHSVLEYAAAVLATKASEKGLELTCEREPGTPWLLRGDPGRLRQVLVNLLGNAVKFTPQGEVAIRARLEAEDERRATLRFTVCDTGIGFQQGRATALFEPFVQGDGSTTRRYGGTGLGLTISKQLVEMMGGQIGVESEEGKGTTFWFTAVFEKQPRPSVVLTDAPPGLQDTKVLVVDDNATNRSLVCRFLNSWGCRVQESADGNSALAILHHAAQGADPFQIALLDKSLPGMDGEELGGRIAADPQLKQTALVLMTGFGRRRLSDWAHLQALGFTGHVSKPIWEHSLREALRPLGAKPSGAAPTAAVAGRQPRVVQRKNQARILVAEDNLTNQEVAVAMLNKLGYRADVVAHGVDVLQALRETDYDAVLMDCEMPEMDGYEATRQIRERRTGTPNPNIPIIALTADAMSGDRDKCLQAGMSDYLTKPVEPRQLAEVLEKWLVTPVGGEVSPPADPSPAEAEAVFNQENLLARLMGDQGLANRVMAGFLNDVPRQLRTLKDRLDAGDAHAARLQAHTLKGAAATVSAEALLGFCCEVEAATAAEELSRALALLPRLEEQFELLKATLKQSGWV
jgi:PAS domain S-box-containing protein